MNHFTIKDIENLCGIKAHTLRVWEQRYPLFVAKRKKSLHRVYDNDDLKTLLRISYLYHNGHKISKIAELGPERIHELIQKSSGDGCNHEIYIHQLLEAGMDFDKEKFEKEVNCLVLRIGLEKSLTEVFFPFLQRIGMLWMTNHLVPAQEHFISHIIRKKIIVAIDGLETSERTSEPFLVFAPTGEFHEIPLLVVNYYLKKFNNCTVYFGTNVSTETLKHYTDENPAGFLYAHVITHMENCGIEKYVHTLCKEFPGKQIILSGPAVKCIQQKPGNLIILDSLDAMAGFARMKGDPTATSASHNSSHLLP